MKPAGPGSGHAADSDPGPGQGPRILFFSGGSAIGPLSARLTAHTHNSIHLITPFDSGGSSAVLRRAFAMPAVGDVRNRLMSLADRGLAANHGVYRLFSHRLPKDRTPEILTQTLHELVAGSHHLIAAIPQPTARVILDHLGYFLAAMPPDFDLAGASLGNLVLTGGYLHKGRRLAPVIDTFSRLAKVRGLVRPVVNQDLHLAAELADGRTVVGQHLITGREAPPLTSPIVRLYLTKGGGPEAAPCPAPPQTLELIAAADLICFPMGSFYSSVLANLLPSGVCRAVLANPCPKVYIPSTGVDREMVGQTPLAALDALCRTLDRSRGGARPPDRLIDFVLLDSARGIYPGGLDLAAMSRMGPRLLDLPLASQDKPGLLDPELLARHLTGLAVGTAGA